MLSFSYTARALDLGEMEKKAETFIGTGSKTKIDYKKDKINIKLKILEIIKIIFIKFQSVGCFKHISYGYKP